MGVMEVKGNLLKEERAEQLKRFRGPEFKTIAKVIMGTPPKGWVEAVHAEILAEKQAKLDADFEAKKKEREKKKAIDERRKKVEEQRKKMEIAKKKAADEKKEEEEKAAEDAKKKAEEGEGKAETKEEEKTEE